MGVKVQFDNDVLPSLMQILGLGGPPQDDETDQSVRQRQFDSPDSIPPVNSGPRRVPTKLSRLQEIIGAAQGTNDQPVMTDDHTTPGGPPTAAQAPPAAPQGLLNLINRNRTVAPFSSAQDLIAASQGNVPTVPDAGPIAPRPLKDILAGLPAPTVAGPSTWSQRHPVLAKLAQVGINAGIGAATGAGSTTFGEGFERARVMPYQLQRLGLENADLAAQVGQRRAQTRAILNPPGKPNATQLEFDKADNLIGFRDQKGNLLGPNNPNLTQDMKDMLNAAEGRARSTGTPESQAMAYMVKHGATPVEAYGALQGMKQDAKPDTAMQNKQHFQDVLQKLQAGGSAIDPQAFTDPRKLATTIKGSNNGLSPEERQFALAYMATNPTPASQALNVILRGASYGATRIYQQYDSKAGYTRPISADEIDRAEREEPGRYRSPAYDPNAISTQAVARDLATGKTKDQIVSFNALLGHVGDLNDGIDQLRNLKSPLINKPINWLMANAMGDPAISNFVQRMEPVKKEYESFLLNNRALYEDDRKAADKIINLDLSPAQMQEAMKQFAHTAAVRLGAANDSYRRQRGTDIPDLLSDEADSTLRTLGVSVPGYKVARTQPSTPPPETRIKIGAEATHADGSQWRFKGGNSADVRNWEQISPPTR